MSNATYSLGAIKFKTIMFKVLNIRRWKKLFIVTNAFLVHILLFPVLVKEIRELLLKNNRKQAHSD